MLQTGHNTEFTLVVWWDRFTGTAVLPHILKTCRHMVMSGCAFQKSEIRLMYAKEIVLLLTDDTLCDPLQEFAKRGHGLDRCPFGEH